MVKCCNVVGSGGIIDYRRGPGDLFVFPIRAN